MHYFILIIAFLLNSCALDPDGYLKKSANGTFFDSKGFHGKKRRPIYNKKYIEQAKQNIIENNTDTLEEEYADDLSELEDTHARHREMYMRMLERDARDQKQSAKQNSTFLSRLLPARDSKKQENTIKLETTNELASLKNSKEELLKEIAEIKLLLAEAKQDITDIKHSSTIKGKDNNINGKVKVSNYSRRENKPKLITKSHAKPPVKVGSKEVLVKNKINRIELAKTPELKNQTPAKLANRNIKINDKREKMLTNQKARKGSGAKKVNSIKKASIPKNNPPVITKSKSANLQAQKTVNNKINLKASKPKAIQTKKSNLKFNQVKNVNKKFNTSKINNGKKSQIAASKNTKLKQVKKNLNNKVANKKPEPNLDNLPWLDEEIVTITPTNEIIITKKPAR